MGETKDERERQRREALEWWHTEVQLSSFARHLTDDARTVASNPVLRFASEADAEADRWRRVTRIFGPQAAQALRLDLLLAGEPLVETPSPHIGAVAEPFLDEAHPAEAAGAQRAGAAEPLPAWMIEAAAPSVDEPERSSQVEVGVPPRIEPLQADQVEATVPPVGGRARAEAVVPPTFEPQRSSIAEPLPAWMIEAATPSLAAPPQASTGRTTTGTPPLAGSEMANGRSEFERSPLPRPLSRPPTESVGSSSVDWKRVNRDNMGPLLHANASPPAPRTGITGWFEYQTHRLGLSARAGFGVLVAAASCVAALLIAVL